MPKRRKVDASRVIEAVKSGRLSKDTMDTYGLEKPSPKSHGRGAGTRKAGGRRREAGSDEQSADWFRDVKVNKRGSLVLPRTLLEEMGFDLEDAFVIRKTRTGISLRKV
ncbi:MAG: hypothetical protein SV487_00765 [Thermodesulfobacteriota bacterium]|nr:hypothetical protein [Thermodesulfobacteriota bacterium]